MNEVISDLIKYLIENNENQVSLLELEELLHYNKFYIVRAFKEYTGYTITEFINNIRVLKSIDPLLFTDDTILKIALNSGFNSQEYYSETFKGVIGLSPKRFKKEFTNLENIDDIYELESKKEYLEQLHDYKEYLYNLECYDNQKKLRKVA